jgi:1,4-dihydroxy-2-naphthoate octaprenyltransferase
MTRLGVWWLAVRPRTLTLAAVPVVVGSTLAWYDGASVNISVFLVAICCALLIQAGTNLFNDAADAQTGNDGPDRHGPLRVTGSGLLEARVVKRAAWWVFALALLGGAYLVWLAGWPILAIGLGSLAAGWAYSHGPRPLSHSAAGEVAVILFFGVVAVSGSDYLQRGTLAPDAVWIGLALGLHAAAVLLLNNLRDHECDRRAGRRTLVHLIGLQRAYQAYAALLLAPFVVLAATLSPHGLGLAWLALPFCIWLIWRGSRLEPSPAMNTQLGLTSLGQLLLGSFLSYHFLSGSPLA